MERTALKKIIEWNRYRTKPLIIYGARQIGKTYLIKKLFAERFYKNNYVYIDFKQDDDIRTFVLSGGANGGSVCDAKKIIEYISLRKNIKISSKTLLIFDESQEALPIITSLKYFKQDYPKIPVIVSGSMVRLKIKREIRINNQQHGEGFFFPIGAVEEMQMYPMSFEEFLLNYNSTLLDKIHEAYSNKKPLENFVHEIAVDALYKYLLVGGMPENVEMFLNGRSLIDVRKNISSIFNNYLNDMELYQVSTESIVRSKLIFNNIYMEINKESKNFRASLLDSKLKTRDLLSPIDWLVTSGVILKSNQTKELVSIPLCSDNESNYRIYMMDTGFLAFQSSINMATFIDKNSRNTLSGAFFENYVACELNSHGFPLFYWKGKHDSEFEFLVKDSFDIIPLDVKKGRGTLNSLNKFKDHNRYKYSVKVSLNNYGYDENTNVMTIPLYMLFEYLNELNKQNI